VFHRSVLNILATNYLGETVLREVSNTVIKEAEKKVAAETTHKN
jgi:hypothetical protein